MRHTLTDEQEWITRELKQFLARNGSDAFLAAPLVVASPAFFPDHWTADASGVAVVTRRALGLAGIESPAVHMLDHTPLAEKTALELTEFSFVQVTDRGVFEFDLTSVGNSFNLLGVLSHELGRAYLAHQARQDTGGPFRGTMAQNETDAEAAARGTIASVCLGFGVPATNLAHRAAHGGYTDGGMSVTEWAIATAGGLSPSGIEFLLALQLIVRDSKDDIATARKHLGTNQRVAVDMWLEELEPDRAGWLERLQLPGVAEWPPRRNVAAPETPPGTHTIDVPVAKEQLDRFNDGRPVFRVIQRRTVPGGVLGLVVGGVAGILLAGPLGLAALGASAGIGVVVGAVAGRRAMYHECSDSGCQRLIPSADETCPACGGRIVGELANANDRLHALEAFEGRDSK